MNNKKTEQKPTEQTEKQNEKIRSLDDLVEVLDQDDLRHVIGGGRPKGPPHVATW